MNNMDLREERKMSKEKRKTNETERTPSQHTVKTLIVKINSSS